MRVLKLIILGVCAFNMASFAVAAMTYFKRGRNPDIQEKIVKIGALLSIFVQLYAIYFHSHEIQILQAIALVLGLGATGLFFLTLIQNRDKDFSEIYSTDEPTFLQKKGIYSTIRNPFYTAYIISYCAGVVATFHYIVILQTFLMVWIYFRAVKFEERKFLNSSLHQEYKSYMSETGRFFPRLTALKGGDAIQ